MSETKQRREQQQLEDIEAPDSNDIISGRGKRIMKRSGNRFFREMISKHREDFQSVSLEERKKIVAKIVDVIYNLAPPGRFLKQDVRTKLWYDIGRNEALVKTRQALGNGKIESSNTNISVHHPTDKNGVMPEVDSAKISDSNHCVASINKMIESNANPSNEMRQRTTLPEVLDSTYEGKDNVFSESHVANSQEQLTQENGFPSSRALKHSLENQGQFQLNSSRAKRQCLPTNDSSGSMQMNHQESVWAFVPVYVFEQRVFFVRTAESHYNA